MRSIVLVLLVGAAYVSAQVPPIRRAINEPAQTTAGVTQAQTTARPGQDQTTADATQGQTVGVTQAQTTARPGQGQTTAGVTQAQTTARPGQGQTTAGVTRAQTTARPGQGQTTVGVTQAATTARFQLPGAGELDDLDILQDFEIPDEVPGAPEIEVVDIRQCNNRAQEANETQNETSITGDKWAIPQKVPRCFEISWQCRRICFPFYDLDAQDGTCSGQCKSVEKVIRKHCINVRTPKLVRSCRAQEQNDTDKGCKLDLTYLLDKSGSLNANGNFKKAQTFLNAVSTALLALPTIDAQIALVTFGEAGEVAQNFTNSSSDINDAVNGQSVGGLGNMASALNLTKSLYPHRSGAKRALIAVSDGLDSSDILSAANAARAAPNEISTYGVYVPYSTSNTNLDKFGRRNMQAVAGNVMSHFFDTFDATKLQADLVKICLPDFAYDVKDYVLPRLASGVRKPSKAELDKLDA